MTVVVVVGNHRLILEALSEALATTTGVSVHWCSPEHLDREQRPDVWLVETSKNSMTALAILEEDPARRAPTYLLDLGDDEPVPKLRGVRGTIGADLAVVELADLVRRPAESGGFRPSRRAGGLSPREVEILGELALGATQGAIAESLSVSTQTVRTHIQNAMVKLGAHSRREAITLARDNGWLRDDSRPERWGAR